EEGGPRAGCGKEFGKAVDAVVAAPVGNKQGFLVVDTHKARSVPARRAIEAVRPCRGQREERRRLDEGPVMAGDAVSLFGDRWAERFSIDALERLNTGNDVIAKFRHLRLRKGPTNYSR